MRIESEIQFKIKKTTYRLILSLAKCSFLVGCGVKILKGLTYRLFLLSRQVFHIGGTGGGCQWDNKAAQVGLHCIPLNYKIQLLA
jgi:hypothetical protein